MSISPPARGLLRRYAFRMRSLFVAAVLLAVPGHAAAAVLKIGVAANFVPALQDLAPLFTQETGHALLISGASTGTLYAQIRNGAPFDILLSADLRRPQQLITAGLADAGFVYAEGVLVLYAPQHPLPANLELAVREPALRFLAVANPKTAPYGAAAAEVLAQLEAEQPLRAQRVIGSSIGQAFQYVVTGNAQMGLVAWSQVLALPAPVTAAHVLHIDASRYRALEQGGVVLKRSPHRAAAADFVAFLLSDAIQTRLALRGYRHPARRAFP